ncbi:MAG: hypothetical protein A3F11_07425 [Gammaproteobacteria bacterium RIFCSPHIGHO2_12_FULL_37_14]|nr:MAG: hypothetical protein A3F11_07425 [Gammaproteobacteria bacterium RIFCSPHIGHO2_12_FULL_37_14]
MSNMLISFDKVIAIQNCGSSGTLLIQSLLDNHPQILSLPALHGQQLLIFWENHDKLDATHLLQAFLQDHQYWFHPENRHDEYGLLQMGSNMNEQVHVDQELFSTYLSSMWNDLTQLTRKDFIISIYLAYNQALNRTIDSSSWILYPIHSLPKKYALQLTSDFSKVYFLHMIREPIQNMGSTAKHINRYGHWINLYLLSCVISQMLHDIAIHAGCYQVHGMYPYVNDVIDGNMQCRAIRLEDLHKNSAMSLSAICKWLNLSWSDTLLESSFDGKLWHNRRESVRQLGVGTKTLAQKHNDIFMSFDKFRLNFISNFFGLAFNYQKKFTIFKKIGLVAIFPLLFLPFKMELLISRYQKQIKQLRETNNPEIRKILGRLGKSLNYHFPASKIVDVLTILIYNLVAYMSCRKLLFLAWKKSLVSRQENFVKLL